MATTDRDGRRGTAFPPRPARQLLASALPPAGCLASRARSAGETGRPARAGAQAGREACGLGRGGRAGGGGTAQGSLQANEQGTAEGAGHPGEGGREVARPLPPSFYARDTARVARDLLGRLLETRIRRVTTAGRIVEVEAYVGPHDPAAHGYGNRRTARNDRLFGPPGTAYVYFTYGMHWCFNAVTERDGYPSAVLIRALEPLEGVATMRRRRRVGRLEDLCAGPARLCQALGITGRLNGSSLSGPSLCVLPGAPPARAAVRRSPRIGISRATTWPLRFYLADSPFVSRPERREGGSGKREE
ncbi:MAG: DNA-3-methyladenine glycosylase [Gemmatimonadetes bacterium]|nr:DNA-3-methyladenine glycosylase [Gemmatimonadota bacterium]